MDIFDGLFGGLFGQIMQDLQRRMALDIFICSNPWMAAGDKDFTAYPTVWGDCENIVAEHPGCSDEDLERGQFLSTVGMIRWNAQNPELAIHKSCLEKDRL